MTSPYVTFPQPAAARPSAWPVLRALLSVVVVLGGVIGALVAAFFATVTWSGCFIECSGTNHAAGAALALLAVGLLAGGPLVVALLYRSRAWVWVGAATGPWVHSSWLGCTTRPDRLARMSLPLQLLAKGKVRDVYAVDDEHVLLVASDRLSAYDVILPTGVPDKGAVLTGMSVWWFEQLADLVPHHLVTARVSEMPGVLHPHADELRARSMLCRRLDMVAVECVARGYLSGSGLVDYGRTGSVCGVALPTGLVEGSRLPEPIFTPTTKAPVEEHDLPMTYAEVVTQLGAELAAEVRETTLSIYRRGASVAERAGILLADTKVELGHGRAGELTLGDEVLTPDSSRFWPAASWAPGGPQPSYDKQYVRDWLTQSGWNRTAPGPELPAEVVERTREKYVEAFELLTGSSFDSWLRDSA